MTSTSVSDPGYGIAPPGYRLPASLRLGAVHLQVGDLERSLDYYTRVLGLVLQGREGGHARLGAEGGGEALVELVEKPGAAPVARGGRLGLYHFALLLPDRPSLGRFLSHLGAIGARAGASDHLVSEALYLTDPDGLGIEIYADRPRSEWAHRGRELVMTTEPLDVPSVVAAGGGVPWTGMPAGTRMGHVHLHVADLGAAARFYHEALGMDRVVWSYPGALFLSAGGYHHHLGLNTWAADARPAGDDETRLLEWEIVLPDDAAVEEALQSVQSAGAAIDRAGNGGVVRDPWGTRLRVRR